MFKIIRWQMALKLNRRLCRSTVNFQSRSQLSEPSTNYYHWPGLAITHSFILFFIECQTIDFSAMACACHAVKHYGRAWPITSPAICRFWLMIQFQRSKINYWLIGCWCANWITANVGIDPQGHVLLTKLASHVSQWHIPKDDEHGFGGAVSPLYQFNPSIHATAFF